MPSTTPCLYERPFKCLLLENPVCYFNASNSAITQCGGELEPILVLYMCTAPSALCVCVQENVSTGCHGLTHLDSSRNRFTSSHFPFSVKEKRLKNRSARSKSTFHHFMLLKVCRQEVNNPLIVNSLWKLSRKNFSFPCFQNMN